MTSKASLKMSLAHSLLKFAQVFTSDLCQLLVEHASGAARLENGRMTFVNEAPGLFQGFLHGSEPRMLGDR